MSRAVLLGTGAFPFLLTYWIKLLSLWDEVVDRVYISVDGYPNFNSFDGYNVIEARDFVRKKCAENKKIVLFENTADKAYGWPQSYKYAYEQSKEDVFLIVHDDTFIFDKKIIDEYFKIAEQDKVVVPLHQIYSCPDIIEPALDKKYPGKFPLKVVKEIGDVGAWKGYSFLLYFLFISRNNLEKTNKNFNGYHIKHGEYSDLLGIIPERDCGGDTGFGLGLELFKAGVNFYPVPRFNTAPLAFEKDALKVLREWRDTKVQIFDQNAGWLHLQNSGNTLPLWYNEIDQPLSGENWTAELQKIRLAWLLEMLECDSWEGIENVKDRGWRMFYKVQEYCKADLGEIKKIKNIFHKLIWK